MSFKSHDLFILNTFCLTITNFVFKYTHRPEHRERKKREKHEGYMECSGKSLILDMKERKRKWEEVISE